MTFGDWMAAGIGMILALAGGAPVVFELPDPQLVAEWILYVGMALAGTIWLIRAAWRDGGK